MAVSNISRVRLRLTVTLFLLITVFMMGRLYFIQVVNHDGYIEKADRQYVRSSDGNLDRGTIYWSERDGNLVTAAGLESGFSVVLNTNNLKAPEEAFEKLKSLIPTTREEFMLRGSRVGDPHEVVARRIPKEKADQISKLNIAGVSVEAEKWRTYPNGEMGAHALGFMGYKDDTVTGRYGLEQFYNEVLRRAKAGSYRNFFAELFTNVKDVAWGGTLKAEGDIVTAIEPTVSRFLDQKLASVLKKYNASGGGAIVIDPKTGEIIAMSVGPTFDPNRYNEVKDPTVFSNPFVENVFEMGSIIKPLTMAIGIDSGAVTAKTTYNDEGTLTLNNKTISNFDGKARGVVPMQEILNQSLNTGVAFVEQKVGNKLFAEYLKNLGFGEETGIDLPNETHGLIKNLESNRDIEYATASFGQGIALTPIETVRALSALANGGVLPSPRVGREIRYRVGGNQKITFDEGVRVFKKETTDEVSRMLVAVVDNALLGGSYKMPRWSVAAKTGTAQIANPKGGGYYEDRFLHSFFTYFPAYNPRFLVFFYMREPKGVAFASHTLTEPAMSTVKFLIHYYDIPPDR